MGVRSRPKDFLEEVRLWATARVKSSRRAHQSDPRIESSRFGAICFELSVQGF